MIERVLATMARQRVGRKSEAFCVQVKHHMRTQKRRKIYSFVKYAGLDGTLSRNTKYTSILLVTLFPGREAFTMFTLISLFFPVYDMGHLKEVPCDEQARQTVLDYLFAVLQCNL